MNLLIVDDDDQIREGMTYGIQWETLGIQLVDCCKNGKEALEMLDKEHFDIVITDISMPVFNGVQLMQEVRKTNHDTAFILISGYKEFEYVKAGLTYGAEDYILKPIHLDELIKVVTSTIKKIEGRQTDRDNRALVDSMEKQNLLQKVVEGKETDIYAVKEILQKNGITEKINMLVCSLVRKEEGMSGNLRESLAGYMTEWLAGYSYCMWEINQKELLLIVNTPDSSLRVFHLQQQLQRMLQDMNAHKAEMYSMGISEIGYPSEIPEMYQKVQMAFAETWFVGKGKSMFYKNCIERKNHVFSLERTDEQIRECFNEGRQQDLERLLEEYKRELSMCDKEFVCDFVMKSRMVVVQSLKKTDIQEEVIQKAYVDSSFEDMMKNWSAMLFGVFASIHENENYSKEVRFAIQYIRKNYMNKITAEEVAEQLELSAGYFSRIFKQQTGKTFLKYLNGYRIELARELLMTTNLKVYEVGEKVGISDYFYFTQLFRSVTGTSPKKIRNEM